MRRITPSVKSIIITESAATETVPIRITLLFGGAVMFGLKVAIRYFDAKKPPVRPARPPASANPMYLAEKSHRNAKDSTPIALITPISFSSSFRAAIIVKRIVMRIISIMNILMMRTNTETIIIMIFSFVRSPIPE